MKILRIRLKNLNSLRGEHVIDFSVPPLAESGLFAITGPTGSGKSTILDAITLALYGRAARYGNNANPENMMSRHCGECMAEVEFQVSSGVYRAEWQLHRAKRSATGKIQLPVRCVYDASGQVLSRNVRETESRVEALVGLDYVRFLRSALLAQGEFAQFLKAKPNERAELLESLTGTSIYSELGALAHSETTERERELAAKEAAIAAITLIGEDELAQLIRKIADAKADQPVHGRKIAAMKALLNQGMQLAQALEQDSRDIARQAALATQRAAIQGDLARLQRHRLTIPFQADLATMELAMAEAQAAAKLLEQAQLKFGQTHWLASACLARLKALLTEEISRTTEAIAKEQAAMQEAAQNRSAVATWLKENDRDRALPGAHAALAVKLTQLKHQRGSLNRAWLELRKGIRVMGPSVLDKVPGDAGQGDGDSADMQLAELIAEAEAKLASASQRKAHALEELTLCETNLQNARIVASMDAHRENLREGEACPLCGSTEHPYRTGDQPALPFAALEQRLKSAKSAAEACANAFNELKPLPVYLTKQRDAIREAFAEMTATGAQLASDLRPFAMEIPLPEHEDELANAIKARADLYGKNLAHADQIDKQVEALSHRIEGRNQLLHDLRAKHARLTGIILPETGISISPQVAKTLALPAMDSVAEAQSYWETYDRQLTIAKTTLEQRAEIASQKAGEWKQRSEDLTTRLQSSPFTHLDELKRARLSEADANTIELNEKRLNADEAELATRIKDNRIKVARWRDEKVPEGDAMAALKAEEGILTAQYEEQMRNLGAWERELAHDKANRAMIKSAKQQLEVQRRQLQIWQRLRGLIGSYDGAKFRSFAQGLSLEILVRHANRQMARLNDRYRLRCSSLEPLEIEILDLHQANAVRPMASLSGGESFLASLALALGLSDIAGRKVRIESLFIDEGFGSLDSDTLDLAISALESLRQENKTIGVISHVDLLKERIATQVRVHKQPGGISSLH